jgi:DNA polymerase III epsilon subunit-like protein
MQYIDFKIWIQSKAIEQMKQTITHLNQLVDEQIQLYKMECKPQTDEVPPEYLEFQLERSLDSLKINILSEFKQTYLNNKKFAIWNEHPVDKPIKFNTNNTLMQKAKLSASAHTFEALPQLAFLDLETDGINIHTANILQVAIIKPIIHPKHETLHYIKTYSSYILPHEEYSQKDNKAFEINHIGDKQLKTATLMEDAAIDIAYHLHNTVIVGYNINSFDIPILKRHLNYHDEHLFHKFSIDLYPACWKNKKQKLGDAIKAYNLLNNPKPHDAVADANCCMDLLNEVIERDELPNSEEGLLDLFSSPQNIWQHYSRHKIIDINPNHGDYSHLLMITPTSSLKRKHSEISNT